MSPPGNLHASTLVRLRSGDPPAPTLALVAAVALHEALSHFRAPAKVGAVAAGAPAYAGARPGRGLQIKWPNDLLVGPAKLAGILLERTGDAVVIGFGANLAHFPDNLERAVTSIAAETGAAPAPSNVVEALAQSFAEWLARWRREGLAPVRAAWLAAAHPVGTRLTTPQGEGTFDGLDSTGALRLRTLNGGITFVHAGDVFLL